jgi:hypothetical protein
LKKGGKLRWELLGSLIILSASLINSLEDHYKRFGSVPKREKRLKVDHD